METWRKFEFVRGIITITSELNNLIIIIITADLINWILRIAAELYNLLIAIIAVSVVIATAGVAIAAAGTGKLIAKIIY